MAGMRDEEVEEGKRDQDYEAPEAVDTPHEAEDDGLGGEGGGPGGAADGVVSEPIESGGFGEGRGIVRVRKRTLVWRRRGDHERVFLRLLRRRPRRWRRRR